MSEGIGRLMTAMGGSVKTVPLWPYELPGTTYVATFDTAEEAQAAMRALMKHADMPNEVTLAQIKESAFDVSGEIWTAILAWAEFGHVPGGEDSPAAEPIDCAIVRAIDSAYEAGRRDEKAHGLLVDEERSTNETMQRLLDGATVRNIAMAAELDGARAEIARLRSNHPEPSPKPVAKPSIGAQWGVGLGVLQSQLVKP